MMRTLTINAKCSDLCQVIYQDEATGREFEHDGYVPVGIGIGGGDYVEITIDIDTGKVVGWKSLPEHKFKKAFEKT